jgi:Protein of unknown function (DUF1553)/Protein of unknown function (DUF1549)/Planctomycete cytochrome C
MSRTTDSKSRADVGHVWVFLFLIVNMGHSLYGDERSTEQRVEFFEQKIRPVLIEHCYECHNSVDSTEGELALDWRGGIAKGGQSGRVLNVDAPGESLLLKLIRHEVSGKEMPSAGPKLSQQVIADFEKWVRDGSIDPRDQKPTEESIQKALSWDAKFERRKEWWSLQPIKNPVIPSGNPTWSQHPVDRFLASAQQADNLAPSFDADAATILRRLQFILIGLPASIDERKDFEARWTENAELAVARKVDELLDNPHFGERWARHWMDWFRYAEGQGGQGDPAIENAYEYRDYLIRALNADIPYDQMLREHLAGDLLSSPRVDKEKGLNESRIGLAHFRFVEHGYFPVDSLDELVKFTDNQIDVVSKAFLGLTVSCARCHDHKFDPISQRDYHALFGVFASSRPAQRTLAIRESFEVKRAELKELRHVLSQSLKKQWLEEVASGDFEAKLLDWEKRVDANSSKKEKSADANLQVDAKKKAVKPKPLANTDLMYAWHQFREHPDIASQWDKLRSQVDQQRSEAESYNESVTLARWSFREGVPEGWEVVDGTGEILEAGALGLASSGRAAVLSILPAGLVSCSATALEESTLTSPNFEIPAGALAARWAGSSAMLRLVPENYPRPGGGLYKQFENVFDGAAHWFGQTTFFWKERRGYFQVMTRRTATASVGNDPYEEDKDDRDYRGSWFHLSEVRLLKKPDDRIKEFQYSIGPLLQSDTPTNRSELAIAYARALQACLQRWQTDAFTDEDALMLTAAIQAGLLKAKLDDMLPEARQAFESLQHLEESIPSPSRSAPGIIDHVGFDQPLLIRGNHRQPGELVPRGFLSVFAKSAIAQQRAGSKKIERDENVAPRYDRLQLANDFTQTDNSLVRRVIVNRFWERVFGRGLVATTDNFGVTGDQPKHPELLDHLASKLIDEAWSLKAMLRYMLTARSFRLASHADEVTQQADPNNRMWTHADVRRVDAETLRDHLLSVSGELDKKMFGPSVSLSAAPKNDRRRGLYVQTKRQQQNELFSLFDVPSPTTTRGTRDMTTTPAQSMTLLNSPFVWYQAEQWSKRSLADEPDLTESQRIAKLIEVSFTRSANSSEIAALGDFLTSARSDAESDGDDLKAWMSLAHLVFNMKEFIYLR